MNLIMFLFWVLFTINTGVSIFNILKFNVSNHWFFIPPIGIVYFVKYLLR